MKLFASDIKLAQKFGRRAVKAFLTLRSCTRIPMFIIIEDTKTIRLQRCDKHLSFVSEVWQCCHHLFGWENVYYRCSIICRNDIYFAELLADVNGTYRNKHPAQVLIVGGSGIRSKEDAPILLYAWTVSWLWSLLQGSEVPFLALDKIWLPRGTLHINAGWSSLPY